MRMAFGLVAILVMVAVWVFWFSETQLPIAKQGNEVKKSAERIAGIGPDGRPATESAKFEPRTRDGRTMALTATEVVPGGALGHSFGLRKGDEVVRVGELDVRDYPGGDDLAIAMIYEAVQRQSPLVVLREGQRLTLTPDSPAGAGPGLLSPRRAGPNRQCGQHPCANSNALGLFIRVQSAGTFAL